jgi:hypothetical protein
MKCHRDKPKSAGSLPLTTHSTEAHLIVINVNHQLPRVVCSRFFYLLLLMSLIGHFIGTLTYYLTTVLP